ncbi:MAG: universal stress protein [Natronohydrobacter sp.]|nr:universal stress protein [Natronohydrobacter sp.]
MYSLRTVLAATDLSRRSAAVLPRAAQLARAHQARLIIAHAVEPHVQAVKRFRMAVRKTPAPKIETEIAKLRAAFPDIEIDTHVATEPPANLVDRLAAEFNVDLVVLGLHLPRRVLDTLRLTNLERITQSVACPVLIAQTRSSAPYRRVLGAITFGPASARALRVAAHISPDAELHAIHALQLPRSNKLPSADLMASPEMTEAELLRKAFLDFETLPARLVTPEIVPGGVHEVLAFRIEELKPDLVVIGSHSGRSPTKLGNYARDLMRAPPTDMLIAKPE